MNHRKGLTAIELLLAVIILSIIFMVILGPFARFRDAQAVNSAVEQVNSLLNQARSATLSGKESSQYGVHLEAGRAVYFKGATFAEPSSYNKEITLDSIVNISSINLAGGGSDVVFDQLTGETPEYGSFVIRSKASTTQKTVTVT